MVVVLLSFFPPKAEKPAQRNLQSASASEPLSWDILGFFPSGIREESCSDLSTSRVLRFATRVLRFAKEGDQI
jgi:hypothetical protein